MDSFNNSSTFYAIDDNQCTRTKLVQLNIELISSHLSRLTIFNILLYIYLYLKVININKPREFTRD